VDNPPGVTVTNPTDGSTVSGTVTVTADASDDNGVDQVEFFVDGSSIDIDTDGSNGWSTSWNTESVGDGNRTVSAEATDDIGQTASDNVSVTVDNSGPPPPSSGMHVGDLDPTSISNGRTWDAVVTIWVHDSSHSPLAGATGNGTWSGFGGGSVVSDSCTTDSTGSCTVRVNGMRKNNGTVAFTVDDVTHSLTYDASVNHDPDGDSTGTSITVSKP
jgi:hypothetical protein